MSLILSLKRTITSLVIILALLVGVLPSGYGFTVCNAANGQAHVEFSTDSHCSCLTMANGHACCQNIDSKTPNISTTSPCHHDDALLVADSDTVMQSSLIKQLETLTGTIQLIAPPYAGWSKNSKQRQPIVFQQKPPPYSLGKFQFIRIKQTTVIQV